MSDQQIVYGYTQTSRPVTKSRSEHIGRHTLLQGMTGSGKGTLIASLSSQFVIPYRLEGLTVRDPIVVIDLGGDQFHYHFLRSQALRVGAVFKTFSLDPLHDTCSFEPLQSCRSLTQSPARMANFVAAGLNLIYSESYGQGFWGRLNLATIMEALETIILRGVTTPTLHHLATELRAMARSHRSSKEASEALFALDQLISYRQLSHSDDADKNLDIAQALEECHVIYFFLPTLFEPLAARAVATLAAWSVIVESVSRKQRGLTPRIIHLFEDEFAQIAAGRSFEDALVLSRKYGTRLILAYQSRQQLRLPQGDIGHVVRDNCPIKIYFTADTSENGDYRDIQGYSKDVPKTRGGQSFHGLSTSTNTHEIWEPKLERNDIVDVSSTFGEALFALNDGKGHHEPLRIMCRPPTDKTEYERLANTPLPARNGQPTTPPLSNVTQPAATSPPEPAIVSPCSSAQHPEASDRSDRIRQLIAAKQRAEQWAA